MPFDDGDDDGDDVEGDDFADENFRDNLFVKVCLESLLFAFVAVAVAVAEAAVVVTGDEVAVGDAVASATDGLSKSFLADSGS